MLVGSLGAGVGASQAIAQVPTVPPQIRAHLMPYGLQRLSIDLNSPTSAQQFFRVGREEFEQEIQRLSDPRSQSTETILKVSPDFRLPQDTLPPESPGTRRDSGGKPGS
jgi:hypothetical protein